MEQNVAKTARGAADSPSISLVSLNGFTQFLPYFLTYLHRSPGDVLETFNFLENAEDSDEDEDEEGDLMDDIGTEKHHRNKKHKTKVSEHSSTLCSVCCFSIKTPRTELELQCVL